MDESLVCWKCGASVAELPLPLARQAECPACGAELHACRMCEFFEPTAADACREPVAEPVQNKERANFCGYFQPRPGVHGAQDEAEIRAARAELEALFGEAPQGAPDEPGSEDEARQRLEALFGAKAK